RFSVWREPGGPAGRVPFSEATDEYNLSPARSPRPLLFLPPPLRGRAGVGVRNAHDIVSASAPPPLPSPAEGGGKETSATRDETDGHCDRGATSSLPRQRGGDEEHLEEGIDLGVQAKVELDACVVASQPGQLAPSGGGEESAIVGAVPGQERDT